jgi:transposase
MVKRSDFTKKSRRITRYFSESFKKEKVREIERNLITVRQVSKEYEVSDTSVYKWLDKYSAFNKQQVRQIIEPMSDARKIKELRAKIQELERLVGQKQIQLEFKDKMIELAEQMYKIDIKKKLGSQPSSGSGSTEGNTDGV